VLVKERRSERDGGLTGYAVALPGRTDAAGGPVFYSGGKLAADLTLLKLAARWQPVGGPPRRLVGEPAPRSQQETGRDGGLSAEQRAHARAVATANSRRVGRPVTVDPTKLDYAAHLRAAGHTIAEIVQDRHPPHQPLPAPAAPAPRASHRRRAGRRSRRLTPLTVSRLAHGGNLHRTRPTGHS